MEAVMEYLRDLNVVSISLRILLSILIGGILGVERGRKNRPAGLRTYILVCLGSALVMMTNQYVYVTFETGDPVRLGAQVISGIGFLGAGTIIVTVRSQVKGLTTAACLWTSAAIGLAIGIGFYSGAIICTLLVYAGMTVMHRLEWTFISKSRVMDFFAEFSSMQDVGRFIRNLREQNITVSNVELNKKNNRPGEDNDLIGVIFTVKMERTVHHAKMIELFSECPGVKFIEEIL